jgi:hypothetical protein
MASDTFLRRLIELSTCECLEALLDAAAALLDEVLGVNACIELWTCDGTELKRGASIDELTAHRRWIGVRCTIGVLHLETLPADPDDVDLLAQQIAPLAERLLEHENAQRRTLREDLEHVYERRILDALLRLDWNASAVARELSVSRERVARVARRCRRRS